MTRGYLSHAAANYAGDPTHMEAVRWLMMARAGTLLTSHRLTKANGGEVMESTMERQCPACDE